MRRVVKVEEVRADINVTPFADIVLVLLIIFMVVTPMLQKGPAVRLPVAASPPKKPEEKNQIIVAVSHTKEIWLEKERVPESLFPEKVREAYERNPNGTIVVKGDARLPYGDVKKVLLDIKEAGFKTVGLIAERRETR
jgi:biopolymer transport protein ExbD